MGAPLRLPSLGPSLHEGYRSGVGLARGRVGAGGPPSPPSSPSPSLSSSPPPHLPRMKKKKGTTHENTHGRDQEEENEKVEDLTPGLNARTEVQCTYPLLPMLEPDHGGKIKNDLGVDNKIDDVKPRKSEKNILPEYELENQIPTETTWD